MAFPVVQGTNTSTSTGTTSHAVSLPASIVSGETLIVIIANDSSNGDNEFTFPAGWTELFDLTDGDDTSVCAAAYRKADGTEGATITVTSGQSSDASHNSYRINGATDPTVTAPDSNTFAFAEEFPDPPNLTPAGGAADFLWLAGFGANSGDPVTGTPTNYASRIDARITPMFTSTAQRNLNAASENPGTFNVTDDGSCIGVAYTIAIHPGAGAITATGAPSIPIPTASGAAEVINTATGAPSIPIPTASGIAKVIKKATGAVVIAAVIASGAAVQKVSGSGAPTMPVITAAGTAEVINTSSGAPSIALVTAAGVAEVINTASGVVIIPLVIASGTASVSSGITANGAPSIPVPTASGVAEVNNTAAGAPSIPAIQAAGVAEIKNTASGVGVIPSITAAGVAETKKTASGTVSIPLPTVSGVAEVKNTATGAPVLPSIAVSGVAGVDRSASGAPSIAGITAAGVASIGVPAATISGTLAFTKAIIQAGAKQIIITLTADTWVAAGTPFNQVRQIILNGFTAAQSEVLGWNKEVRDKQPVTAVVRTSDTVVTLTLIAAPDYDITTNETCTVTVPDEALVKSTAPLVATPTIAIAYVGVRTQHILTFSSVSQSVSFSAAQRIIKFKST